MMIQQRSIESIPVNQMPASTLASILSFQALVRGMRSGHYAYEIQRLGPIVLSAFRR